MALKGVIEALHKLKRLLLRHDFLPASLDEADTRYSAHVRYICSECDCQVQRLFIMYIGSFVPKIQLSNFEYVDTCS